MTYILHCKIDALISSNMPDSNTLRYLLCNYRIGKRTETTGKMNITVVATIMPTGIRI